MELEQLASIFEAVRVMPLRPTDLLVFRANASLGLEQKAILHMAIEQATGHARILILDGGADLAVIRPEAEPPPDEVIQETQNPRAAHRPIAPSSPPKGSAPGAIS